MKKILIAQDICKVLRQKNSFLDRADMLVLPAASHDEAIELHRAERADLIITSLDMPGMNSEQFCAMIKEDPGLRVAPIILVCADGKAAIEQSSRCKADVVLPRPFKSEVLLAKAKKLLNISWRDTYRVLLSVSVKGNASGQMFFCRSLDISATGMLIETTEEFNLGDRLVCNFFLPDATRIGASADVVRVIRRTAEGGANRYGVQFVDVDAEAKKALLSFIEARTPKTEATP